MLMGVRFLTDLKSLWVVGTLDTRRLHGDDAHDAGDDARSAGMTQG